MGLHTGRVVPGLLEIPLPVSQMPLGRWPLLTPAHLSEPSAHSGNLSRPAWQGKEGSLQLLPLLYLDPESCPGRAEGLRAKLPQFRCMGQGQAE